MLYRDDIYGTSKYLKLADYKKALDKFERKLIRQGIVDHISMSYCENKDHEKGKQALLEFLS